jgi:superfamily II DNA or RNA helicase
MITIEKIGLIECKFSFNKRTEFMHIKRVLTFKQFDDYMQRFKIVKFYTPKNTFCIAFLPLLIKHLKKNNIVYQFIDTNFLPFTIPQNIDAQLNADLFTHQQTSVKTFLTLQYGIIKVPTRGGKTFIACEIIRLLLLSNSTLKTVFFVDTVDLFGQTLAEFQKYFNTMIGTIKDGEANLQPITVCSIQSLVSIKKSDIKKANQIFKYFNFVILDECESFVSTIRTNLLKKFKVKKTTLWLSATPYKKNNLLHNYKIDRLSGGLVAEVLEKDLKEVKILSEDLICVLKYKSPLNFAYCNAEQTKQKLYFEDTTRFDYIILVLELLEQLKLKTLIICSFIEFGIKLSNYTNIPFIYGLTKTTERNNQKQEFLTNSNFLIASDIYKKGVTLPEAQVLFNVNNSKEGNIITQRRGRILGNTKTFAKRSIVLDIYDCNVPYYNEHFESRLETYFDFESTFEVIKLQPKIKQKLKTLIESFLAL